jgi:hypothetical protein
MAICFFDVPTFIKEQKEYAGFPFHFEYVTCESFERPTNGIVPDKERRMASSCGDDAVRDGKENTVIGRTKESRRAMFLESEVHSSFREMKSPPLKKEKRAAKKKTVT